MTDKSLLALNLVFWLSAALIIGALYATHHEAEPSDYRIAVTHLVEA